MDTSKCFVCLKVLTPKSVHTRFRNVRKDTSDDYEKAKIQLQIVFLLRKILEMPEETYIKLQKCGDPNLWMNYCDSCASFLEKARSIFDQIVVLQNQYEELQLQIINTITLSVKSVEYLDDQSNSCGKELLKNYITHAFDGSTDSSPIPPVAVIKTEESTIPDVNPDIELNCAQMTDIHPDLVHSQAIQYDSLITLNNTDSYAGHDLESDPLLVSHRGGVITRDKRNHQETPLLCNYSVDRQEDKEEYSYSAMNYNITVGTSSSLKINKRKRTSDKLLTSRVGFKELPHLVAQEKCHLESSEMPFKCNICGKGFLRSMTLRQHAKSHTEKKKRKYGCKICGKCYTSTSTLKVHYRKHTGERPFKCNICEKTFARAFILKCHLKVHAA